MDRRRFASTLATAALGAALGPAPLAAAAGPAPRLLPDGDRVLGRLRALRPFGLQPGGGLSRLGYSEADREARQLVVQWMREAGLTPRVDPAGNLIGARPGQRDLPPLLLGSHIDSVPDGGHYDGQLGVVGALEVAETLAESRTPLRHPLEVVVWANEEGGLYGSRAVSGQFKPFELAARSLSGRSIEEGIAFLGGDPQRLDDARRRRGEVAGYLELHIEQGGTLDASGDTIGIVEGIVGIRGWNLRIEGRANHAGTTPMDQRQDALLAAARVIDMVHRTVRADGGRAVGTVGRIEAQPGARNVIAGTVLGTLELRDLDDAVIQRLFTQVEAAAQGIARETGTTIAFSAVQENPPAPSDPRMRALVAEAARGAGLRARAMPSGAGHDAQSLATIAPMGMIFVPSVGGISHAPDEFTRDADCVHGCTVLLAAARAADAMLDG
jgi:beta-ureidopropionase / N-carbamoyl-L-amino-acid hydrolase